MKAILALLIASLALSVTAQSSENLLSVLASEGYSLFSSITSELGNTESSTTDSFASTTDDSSATATSLDISSILSLSSTSDTQASSTSSSQASSTDSQSSDSSAFVTSSATSTGGTSSSQTSFTTQTSSSTSSAGPSSSATAAASAATNTSASSSNNHDRVLAIVLGTVLGALALGLLILLCIILCGRRRKRRARDAGAASLSSNSDETLTGHKSANSRVTPRSAALGSRRSNSFERSGNIEAPLMAERTNYGVPSPHAFQDGSSAPFLPQGGDTRGSSGLVPTRSGDSLGSTDRFYQGNGLNNHPSHGEHHTGAMLAAGAGGAALGAAAARHHSRSSERNHDPRLSGEQGVHPAFWDEPPPRSPSRPASDDFRRRSGSMPRNRFSGPSGHANSPVRNGAGTGVAELAAGTVAGAAAANNAGHQNGERGRRLPANPPPYNGTNNAAPRVEAAADGAVLSDGRPGLHSHSHSRSRSGPHHALPPSLVIPSSGQVRNLPSRSPKRTRFASGNTYHEANPFEGGNGIDDASRSPVISRDSYAGPMSAGTATTDGYMSPVSPEDTARHSIGQGLPMVPGRANVVDVSGRGVSPNRPARQLPAQRSQAGPAQPARSNVQGTTTQTKHHSGLVNTIQDHFTPSTNPTNDLQAYAQPPPTYQAFNPAMQPPIARKPVAQGQYNPNTPRPAFHTAGGSSSKPESWWRSQEDSAWADSYSNNGSNVGVGQAR